MSTHTIDTPNGYVEVFADSEEAARAMVQMQMEQDGKCQCEVCGDAGSVWYADSEIVCPACKGLGKV